MEDEWILTVADLNEYVRKSLAADPMLRRLRLRGEISNFKRHSSGHWYFTLKDQDCRISCVMFRQHNYGVSIRPADGMAVVVSGSVSLYAQGGSYQFYAEGMRPDGVGSLYARFEELKARLTREGLFDSGRKRPLPLVPERIAVVTSSTGAVIHDIRIVSARRNPAIPLVLIPVNVQGAGAAEEIADGIRAAGRLPGVDVILTGRGGGSMEDLWAFNEECVVRAIAESPVPVVSAVGHETDVTLSDFAADVRAATPSMAAELVVQDRRELLAELNTLSVQLTQSMRNRLLQTESTLAVQRSRITACHPSQRLLRQEHALERIRSGMSRTIHSLLKESENRVSACRIKLTALGPAAVLERGFALVMHDERIIPSAAEAQKEKTLQLRFRDGILPVSVEKEQ